MTSNSHHSDSVRLVREASGSAEGDEAGGAERGDGAEVRRARMGNVVGWLLATLAFFYPELIAGFDRAIAAYRVSGSGADLSGAVFAIVVAHLTPLLAGARLAQGGSSCRGMLVLLAAVPPLWVALWVLGFTSDKSVAWKIGWAALWALFLARRQKPAAIASPGLPWLRVTHGIAAAVVALFLVLHLTNHVLALAGADLHAAVMQSIRPLYRSAWTEPVILLMFMLLFVSGCGLAVHHLAGAADRFRAVQLGSGVYIGVFLLAHVAAVLLRRAGGGETDWNFATGSLLRGGGMLIPYYGFAVVALWVHVGCGLRGILLSHGTAGRRADQVVVAAMALGVVTATAVMSAALGLRLF